MPAPRRRPGIGQAYDACANNEHIGFMFMVNEARVMPAAECSPLKDAWRAYGSGFRESCCMRFSDGFLFH
jgi:hypothetical protein